MRRSRKPLGRLPRSRGFESLPLRHKHYLTSGFSVLAGSRWSAFRLVPRGRAAYPCAYSVGTGADVAVCSRVGALPALAYLQSQRCLLSSDARQFADCVGR